MGRNPHFWTSEQQEALARLLLLGTTGLLSGSDPRVAELLPNARNGQKELRRGFARA